MNQSVVQHRLHNRRAEQAMPGGYRASDPTPVIPVQRQPIRILSPTLISVRTPGDCCQLP